MLSGWCWVLVLDRILLELKPREDPVWIYLDAAHANLLDKLTAVYSAQMANVQGKHAVFP